MIRGEDSHMMEPMPQSIIAYQRNDNSLLDRAIDGCRHLFINGDNSQAIRGFILSSGPTTRGDATPSDLVMFIAFLTSGPNEYQFRRRIVKWIRESHNDEDLAMSRHIYVIEVKKVNQRVVYHNYNALFAALVWAHRNGIIERAIELIFVVNRLPGQPYNERDVIKTRNVIQTAVNLNDGLICETMIRSIDISQRSVVKIRIEGVLNPSRALIIPTITIPEALIGQNACRFASELIKDMLVIDWDITSFGFRNAMNWPDLYACMTGADGLAAPIFAICTHVWRSVRALNLHFGINAEDVKRCEAIMSSSVEAMAERFLSLFAFQMDSTEAIVSALFLTILRNPPHIPTNRVFVRLMYVLFVRTGLRIALNRQWLGPFLPETPFEELVSRWRAYAHSAAPGEAAFDPVITQLWVSIGLSFWPIFDDFKGRIDAMPEAMAFRFPIEDGGGLQIRHLIAIDRYF